MQLESCAPPPAVGEDGALEPLTALLLEAVRELCGAEAASLLLRQPDGSLVLEMADGAVGDLVRRRRLSPGEGVAGRVLRTGQAEIALPPFSGLAAELSRETGFLTRGILAVPLFDGDGLPVAVCEAVNPVGRGSFDAGDLASLQHVAPAVSVGLRAIADMQQDGAAMGRFYRAVLDVTTARATLLHTQNRTLEESRATFELAEARRSSDEKMAGLARMAAGVAHEINNPLAVVLSNVSSLAVCVQDLCATVRAVGRAVDAGASDPLLALAAARDALAALDPDQVLPDMGQTLQEIQTGLERISGIVSRLTVFGDQDPGRIEPIDLAAEGRRIAGLLVVHGLGRRGGPPVHVTVEDVPPVPACRAKIQQVLVEIVDNAQKAAARSEAPEGGRVDVRVYGAGDEVHVRVVDNGPGIAEAERGRIFDPFYTTKTEWRAVGLGLSVAYGVVRSLGGRIAVESTAARGAAVTVSFPTTGAAAAPLSRMSPRARSGRYYEDLR